MLDVKQEENLRARELRTAFENAYDAWAEEAPQWGYNQAIASEKPATAEVSHKPSLEIVRLRQIRQFVEAIGQ